MVNHLIISIKCDFRVGCPELKVSLMYCICAVYVLYMYFICALYVLYIKK